MKNLVIFGVVIGVLSGLWIVTMHLLGYSTIMASPTKHSSALLFTSVLIPVLGLYFGVKRYRDVEKVGKMTFFEAMGESFKILIIGGMVSIAFAILYIAYVAKGSSSNFSGGLFGALLVGIICALAVSLFLMKGPTSNG